MQIHYRNQSEFGGVYKITNILNGRVYIGSTSCFRKRAASHKCNLEANRHLNKFMQNDFNKSGTESFLFEVLEVVAGDKQERLDREQFYIDQWYDNQKTCYNLAKEAKDTRSGTRNKKEIDPLTDGRCQSYSEERLTKHTEKMKEVWRTPELKELGKQNAMKRWDKHSANLKVRNIKTNEEVLITGSIRQWCKDVGVSYKAFHQLVKGKLKSSGGWALIRETE